MRWKFDQPIPNFPARHKLKTRVILSNVNQSCSLPIFLIDWISFYLIPVVILILFKVNGNSLWFLVNVKYLLVDLNWYLIKSIWALLLRSSVTSHCFINIACKIHKHTVVLMCIYIQGGFFNWSALKMTKCQTLRKFWHLELFWRDLHVIWHLVIF